MMRGKNIGIIVIAVMMICPIWTNAQDLFIKNGTLLTVTKGTIENGDILIRNGIIQKIGRNLAPPPGIKVIDATGKYVIPGLIDPHTHIAITDINESSETITPEVSVGDVLNADDPRIYYALTGGVTIVHTMHGSGNPIGGQNIVLKLTWGRPSEEMVVHEAFKTIKFALGENPKQSYFNPPTPRYPKTRMGVAAIIRREFMKAKAYMEKWDRYQRLKESKNPPEFLMAPRRDLRMETLADVLKGKTWVRCHTYRADETLELVNLSKELRFKIACVDHASEAYKIAKELAAEGIGASMFIDTWAYKMETAEGIAYNAAYCAKNGVVVSLNSDSGPQMMYLFNDAAKAMKYGGLSESEALKLITLNPAIHLGVEKIVGSLEAGKHGDLAIFSEHTLSSSTCCEMTIIEGEIYFDRAAYLEEREKKQKEREEQEEKSKKKKEGGRG